MVKVERPKMVQFDSIGDTAEGYLVSITEGETQFGTARFLQLADDDGKKSSVCVSASLALTPWEDLEGLYVRIEYTGDEKSKKQKNKTYKTFDIQHEAIPE
jgi:hypothetical protein